ncbi:MAG: dihydroorotate dehydrogenase electron transfer subunit [Treponema sp.]|nr:dihydroorotate dehydrogenase electron transfer subunit [Treponema sp.]
MNLAPASTPAADKRSLGSRLVNNITVTEGIFSLDFTWEGPAPRAGQFFMIRPKRGSLFLARPVSVARWEPERLLGFLIARRGRGTGELLDMRPGEEADLTGPLGNGWGDFPLPKGMAALVGGGAGLAPLGAFAGELGGGAYDLYAGFRTRFSQAGERNSFLGPAVFARRLTISTEDGSEGLKGRIPDFFDPAGYAAVYACGPEPMLKAVAERCKAAAVPCFVSMERRMACGVGACLGCTVKTVRGNRRCCADGPVFPAGDLVFDE